jgi:protein-tyrosine phosphatase
MGWMPQIIDFLSADDPRDVVHQVVQTLAEGELVGLPTETGYVAAASPLKAPAGQSLGELRTRLGAPRLVLALKTPHEALDYVPRTGPLGRKLIRRFWPGPVTFLFEEPTEAGLAGSFPEVVRRELRSAGGLALRVPGHEFIWNALRLLPAPLAVLGEDLGGNSRFTRAASLVEAAGDRLKVVVDAGPSRYDLPTSHVRVSRESWEIVRDGVVSARTLRRLAGTMYLFVCTGNTCRSPMAEGLFRKLLADRLKCPEDELVDRGFMVASAGVAAGAGSPPSSEAVEILSARGVDLRAHESQPATPQLLSQADQIFTMTRSHRDMLMREFPEAAPRVKLLASDGMDVIDPIGAGLDEYRRCADQIERCLEDLLAEVPAT